ncbi:hypothetical protein FSP39_017048 [Pinctada imbricata]|uniref:GPI transamidase component PIG-S n=1 Tax=Pinctada imbricata TaxID=66713 RepID=A0AA89BTU7_PINIB|nr:hypothetical protein FSP39_017048 [Pinctada imbricata]
MTEKDDNRGIKRQHYAALGVGFVCVIIGLPLWWKTTEVYRVSLPYSDIADLTNVKIKCVIDVDVINTEPSLTDNNLADLSRIITASLGQGQEKVVHSSYRVSVRQGNDQQKSEVLKTADVKGLDTTFSKQDVLNHYQMVLLPKQSGVKVKRSHVSNGRAAYFTTAEKDLQTIAQEITNVVHSIFVKESTLLKTFRDRITSKRLKPDKESMRSVKSALGYDILFTLVNPQPDILDIQWDIKQAVRDFLGPLSEKLKEYVSLNIQSQVIYFTGLYKRPKKDSKLGEFYYTEKDLPLLINPLEAKLGSHASSNPSLNFLVYIPSREQHPLFIMDQSGSKVPSNSFLSPRWGGIYIYNVKSPSQNASLPHEVSLNMKQVMEVFISQLRLLLNLNNQIPDSTDVGNQAIRLWELDGWLRQRCIENLATSIHTLQSLTQLLERISNIVINDDIGNEVEEALSGIRQSQRYLAVGQLDKAFIQSRKALAASDKAFFDPSLLELLYFPEDQKFAIYIPLFLPISLPILGSLYKTFQWMKTKRKTKQE